MANIDISIDDRHTFARLHHRWTETVRSTARPGGATFEQPLFETPAPSGRIRYLDVHDVFVAYLEADGRITFEVS